MLTRRSGAAMGKCVLCLQQHPRENADTTDAQPLPRTLNEGRVLDWNTRHRKFSTSLEHKEVVQPFVSKHSFVILIQKINMTSG